MKSQDYLAEERDYPNTKESEDEALILFLEFGACNNVRFCLLPSLPPRCDQLVFYHVGLDDGRSPGTPFVTPPRAGAAT